MPFTLNPTLLENDEVEITTDANGDLAIQNKANVNTLTIDETVSISSKADADGGGTASLTNYQSIDTDSASVANQVTAGSVDTAYVQFIEQSSAPSGETGVRKLFADSSGNLMKVNPDGTTEAIGGSSSYDMGEL